MIFQSALSKSLAEVILRAARCGLTYTLTNTSTTLPIVKGPVIIATGTDWNDGTYVAPAVTSTGITNNLFAGIVYDYSQLHTNTAARWGGETQGLVQVYGVVDGVCAIKTDSQAAGSILVPDFNEFVTSVGPHTAATANSSDHAECMGLGGLAVLLEDIADSTATSTGNYSVFLRCM